MTTMSDLENPQLISQIQYYFNTYSNFRRDVKTQGKPIVLLKKIHLDCI